MTNNVNYLPNHKIKSKVLSYSLLTTAIIGGIGGAILVGILLEDIMRSVFGLKDPDMLFMIITGVLIVFLGLIGTGALVAAFYIENKTIKVLTIAFSVPIPILFEVVDLIIRFMNVISDIYNHYSIPL